MISPTSIAANLSTVLYLARHRAEAEDELREAVRVLAASCGETPLALEVTPAWLEVNGTRLSSGPGARQVGEYLLGHGVKRVEIAATPPLDDLVVVVRALAAFPGLYSSWEEFLSTMGSVPSRVRFMPSTTGQTIVSHLAMEPMLTAEGERDLMATLHAPPVVDEAGLIPPPLKVAPPPPPPPSAELQRTEERHKLDGLVKRGRGAAEASDWVALLGVAQEFLDAEQQARSEAGARVFRFEFKRLFSRREITQIARLAGSGAHRDLATQILRRLGEDATEVLMDLLIEADAMAERRGYYSALTRMADGTSIIIQHLDHPMWYVVRNAAELCGEMNLTKAVPDLARQIAHPDERVRKSVAGALLKIGTPDAIEPLAKLMKDPAPAIRMHVIGALEGAKVRGLAMPLAVMLEQEEHPDVCREILLALGRIGTPDAILALRRAAAGEFKRLSRKHRLQAIEGLGLAGTGSVQILRGLAKDRDRELAQAAERALASLNP